MKTSHFYLKAWFSTRPQPKLLPILPEIALLFNKFYRKKTGKYKGNCIFLGKFCIFMRILANKHPLLPWIKYLDKND